MTKEQAWEAICAQHKRGSRRTKMIVLSLAVIVLGAFTLIFYVGIGLVAAGIVTLIVTTKRSKSNNIDVNLYYEKYILADWFASVFDDVVFDGKTAFKKKELKALDVFESDWSDTVCNRCFTASFHGYGLRAAEVVLSGNPGADSNRIGWNYEEPICFFWGRVWEIEKECEPEELLAMQQRLEKCDMDGRLKLYSHDGKLYLLHNLYSATGAYPWWLPAPSGGNADLEKLEREAKESAGEYAALLETVIDL
ncbi:MAG: hypothetical protein HDT13_05710 [Butyrivibrio sp.]|nr:hypothetical protein [Butyrivibrio sp.]